MGAGGAKGHESFTVTPSIALLEPPPAGPQATPAGAPPPPAPGAPASAGAPPGAAWDTPEAAGCDEALTPVPAAPPVGLLTGVPLLVGGADLIDSTATLVAYESDGGPREVLVATVAPAAEAKLLEALALGEGHVVPVEVTKQVSGRLPLDEAHQLFEALEAVAKSVNHHLKAGDAIPAHTTAKLEAVTATLATLEAGEAEAAMLAHYQGAAAALAERVALGYAVPYAKGGKAPPVVPYTTTRTAVVTEYVPAPAPEGAELLATEIRGATRLAPAISPDGRASWDGTSRTKASGTEYAIDLGEGYSAVYRPYGANDPKSCEFSLRGALEVVAPPGAGHGGELVARLGQLNLVNRPMSAPEGEWAYLCRNVWAQRLGGHPALSAARAEAEGLEDAVEQVLFARRAHEATGLDDAALHRFARQLRLEAEARALPEKVRLLRDALAQATGHPSGEALAASPGYDPIPGRSGGWLTWSRFDVAGGAGGLRDAFGARGLAHRVSGHNLVEVLRSGVLASTERRHLMGIPGGRGTSEGSDKRSGGACSVFLRVAGKPASGPVLFWADPTVVLRRADWYAYPSDHFGSENPASAHSTSGQTRDPQAVAGFSGGGNEVMVRHGLDLLGAEAPSLIATSSGAERAAVLALLAERGVTHLGGRPVAEVVR